MTMSKTFVRGFNGAPIDATTLHEHKPTPLGPARGYRCPTCDWIGTEDDMLADAKQINDEGDEAWSNWICPSCHTWWQLEDYVTP